MISDVAGLREEAWIDSHDPAVGDAPKNLLLRWLHDRAPQDSALMEDCCRSFQAHRADACPPAW